MYCPKCGSKRIVTGRLGFDWRNGLIGSMFLGDNGILAGLIGSRDIVCKCKHCGFVWKVEGR